MLNALTIDIEDYYHVSAFESSVRFEDWDRYESRVEKNTHRILDILDEHETKATFFVLGWVAERQPGLVRAIDERGHEVASHGYAHQRIYTQTPEQFHKETQRSKYFLEDTIGQPVIGYRAASYSIITRSLWALDILMEEGFLYDSSIFPIWHDLYGIPNSQRFSYVINNGSGSINEYPLSTVRIGKMNFPVGGGGYLRLLPYSFTRWAINRLNKIEKQPAIIYLHPWELDPQQPKLKGQWLSHFRQYTNLNKTEGILKSLLNDFMLGTMKDIDAEKPAGCAWLNSSPAGRRR